MKKLLLSLLCCLLASTGWADEQRKITLSNDNQQETVNLSYCNIFVTLINPDADEAAKVLIEVENLDETKLLALYHQPYNEKQVKKLRPSFKYDKLFGGTKGKRIIDPCSLPMNKDVFVEPSNKYSLPHFNVNADETMVVKLPIYIAKSKKDGIIQRILGKEKLILLRKQVIELDIEVSMKPSAEYLGLQKDIETLKKDVNNAVFCTHRNHRQSVEQQQEPYKKRIDDLKAKIDAAISQHGWSASDGGYQRYAALKDDIDKNIDLNKHLGTCRQHRGGGTPAGHQCSYCSLSLQQIYHKLDDLYKKIYSSNDRQATKASVMGQVNALYNCCTAADCAKHASQWRSGGGGYKSRIQERYNRIQGL